MLQEKPANVVLNKNISNSNIYKHIKWGAESNLADMIPPTNVGILAVKLKWFV